MNERLVDQLSMRQRKAKSAEPALRFCARMSFPAVQAIRYRLAFDNDDSRAEKDDQWPRSRVNNPLTLFSRRVVKRQENRGAS